MTMPRADSSEEDLLQTFSTLQSLLHETQRTASNADTLSMGMSKDLEIAVRAGATMLRIGEALFGPRDS
jgi:uncharacterized pyridoxal phosphate-containing UPF0001 family protein